MPNLQIEDDLALEAFALQTDEYVHDLISQQKYQLGSLKRKGVLVSFDRDVEWQILEEYKEILGFRCQKAISRIGDKDSFGYVDAWFTTEIPFPTGPHSYGELPGLILGLQVKGRYIYALDIFTSTEDHLSQFTTYEKYSQDDFVSLKRKAF